MKCLRGNFFSPHFTRYLSLNVTITTDSIDDSTESPRKLCVLYIICFFFAWIWLMAIVSDTWNLRLFIINTFKAFRHSSLHYMAYSIPFQLLISLFHFFFGKQTSFWYQIGFCFDVLLILLFVMQKCALHAVNSNAYPHCWEIANCPLICNFD